MSFPMVLFTQIKGKDLIEKNKIISKGNLITIHKKGIKESKKQSKKKCC